MIFEWSIQHTEKLTYKIKKTNEKMNRRKAKLFELINNNAQEKDDKKSKRYFKQQSKLQEELEALEYESEQLKQERKKHPYYIKIGEMEESIRYNKLDWESKLFQNIIKMICYRAESSLSILLSEGYKKSVNERRALVKSLINTKVDIIPDYENNKLQVKLYSLSNPKDNKAVENILAILNDTQTIFPTQI